jgi:hemerythrin-like domain-containing protein
VSVFSRGDRPDYEVVLAVIDYFKDYPDSCHHMEGARRLRRVAQAVERVLSDQDLVRQTVDDIIRDFIDHERQHMAMEERVVFPTVLNALRPEDWADIASKLTNRDDPFYQPGFEKKFNTLRRDILTMEEEAEAERPD